MKRKLTLGLAWSSMVRTTKSIGEASWRLAKNIGLLAFIATFIILLAIYTFFEMCIVRVDRKVSTFAQCINPKWFVYIIAGLIILFVLFFSFSKANAAQDNSFKADSIDTVQPKKDSVHFDLDVLAQALIFVESGGNDNAKSDISSASGPLQELFIFVDEANRLSALHKLDTHFDYSDRFDRQKSIDMFRLIQRYHNPDNSFIRAVTLHRGFFSPKYYAAVGEKYDNLMHELGYEGTYTDLK